MIGGKLRGCVWKKRRKVRMRTGRREMLIGRRGCRFGGPDLGGVALEGVHSEIKPAIDKYFSPLRSEITSEDM